MHKIAQANIIDKLNMVLETETDPTKRAMLSRLLHWEEEKLKALTKLKAK
jgi:hypothetical protein